MLGIRIYQLVDLPYWQRVGMLVFSTPKSLAVSTPQSLLVLNVGNGMEGNGGMGEWGNGMIIGDYGSFPHSLLSTSKNMQCQPMNRPTYGKPSKHAKVKCLKQDNKHGIGLREKHWIGLICPIYPPHFAGDMIFGLYPPPRFRFPEKNHHVRLVSHHVPHSSGHTQQNTYVLEVNPSLTGNPKPLIPLKPRNIHQIGG